MGILALGTEYKTAYPPEDQLQTMATTKPEMKQKVNGNHISFCFPLPFIRFLLRNGCALTHTHTHSSHVCD